jgi:hypothetical protein
MTEAAPPPTAWSPVPLLEDMATSAAALAAFAFRRMVTAREVLMATTPQSMEELLALGDTEAWNEALHELNKVRRQLFIVAERFHAAALRIEYRVPK